MKPAPQLGPCKEGHGYTGATCTRRDPHVLLHFGPVDTALVLWTTGDPTMTATPHATPTDCPTVPVVA